jgi:hypothetical protein
MFMRPHLGRVWMLLSVVCGCVSAECLRALFILCHVRCTFKASLHVFGFI